MKHESTDEYCKRVRDPGAPLQTPLTHSRGVKENEFHIPGPFDPLFARLVRFGTEIANPAILQAEMNEFCLKHRDCGVKRASASVTLDPRGPIRSVPSPVDPDFKRMLWKGAHWFFTRKHKPASNSTLSDRLRQYAREPILKKRELKKAPRRIPSGLAFPTQTLTSKFISVSPFDERFPTGMSPRRAPTIKLELTSERDNAINSNNLISHDFECVSPFDARFPGVSSPVAKFSGWKVEQVPKPLVVTMKRLRLDPFPPLTPIAKLNSARQTPVSFGFESPRASAKKVNYDEEKVKTN